jgi:pimeloyl-ACP methyl ester carboxylesterase
MQPRLHDFYVYPKNNDNSSIILPRHIAYTEWGDPNNKKTIICVHGLTRNSRDFDFIAAELANHYRVICPDIIGRGRSSFVTDKSLYNYETYVTDMIALIEYLEVDTVDWIGTSMGGLIAMFLMQNHPQYINKLVLNDIGPFIPKESLQRIAKYIGISPKFNNMNAARDHLKIILSPFGIKQSHHWEHVTTHSYHQTDNGIFLSYDPAIAMAAFRSDTSDIQDFDGWSFWDNITCKTLIIRGEKSDILTIDTFKKMQNSGIRADAIEFKEVGHVPALMEKEQIDEVLSWLLG